MNKKMQRAAKLSVVVLGGVCMVACSSHPKPTPLASTTPTPPPAAQTYGAPPPAAVEQSSNAPIPGSVQDFVVNVGDRVYFDFDKYNIRDDAKPVLDAQASWLSRYPAVRVRIEGNCDELGTREYNLALGARRAETVKDFLEAHGVAGDRIATVSYGKEHPIDLGSGAEARAHNRNAHTAILSGAA